MSARGRVRRALAEAGGVAARGAVREAGPHPPAHPFGEARVVEGEAVRAIPVGTPEAAPDGVGFLAGVQRYVVDGHFGLVPVVRAWVDAGVLVRRGGALRCVARVGEEFVVVPAGKLADRARRALDAVALPVVESAAGSRPHPLLDRWAAITCIEGRRAACELAVAARFLAAPDAGPLVVDGPLAGFTGTAGLDRVIAVVRHHETLYLEANDLEVALTLPPEHRSSMFARPGGAGGGDTHSWYLRLWPWTEEDLVHGLVRVERTAATPPEADRVSRWLLADRAPIASADPRWDRQLYPMHEVGTFLRAHAGGWG